MKFLSQLFAARGTDLTSKAFLQARHKLIGIYLLIIALVICLFSYLVIVQINQREALRDLSPHSEIVLNAREAREVASHARPGSPVADAEYELKDNRLFYEVNFSNGEVVYVDVVSGRLVPPEDYNKPETWYHTITDDTYEIIGWLALVVFGFASVGSILVANATLRPIATSIQKQKRFVSNAAHELRNPLASLQTTLESYLREKNKSQAFSESVATDLLSEVKRLITTSESLLAFEGVEKSTETLQDCNVSLQVDHALSRLSAAIHEKNIVVSKVLSETLVRVRPTDLDLVLYNLLHNAVKFSGVGASISITWDGTVLTVGDTGGGIAAEHLPHIFERFYKADQARGFTGHSNGLGLALVHDIVASYGGRITVDSSVGHGTTFMVTFAA